VMVDAEDLLTDLGVHVETCTNEAAAAAMLGASAPMWPPMRCRISHRRASSAAP
jgi:hypothetical protein